MPSHAQTEQLFHPGRPWLAPLAGYSDLPFRLLCRENGAAVCVTEMVSAKGLLFGSRGTDYLLDTCPEDSPLVVQLFGSREDELARAVEYLMERGFGLFDLNCGCPVPKVARSGSGSIMLCDPDNVVRVVRAMAATAGPGRVGVKFRLGWQMGEALHAHLGVRLEEAGAAWLTLHPRYGRQGFTGKADWGALGELKSAVGVPVIASGDLFSAKDGMRCLQATGVDTVMYARGALADPTIFSRHRSLISGAAAPPVNGVALAAVIRRHAELIRSHGRSTYEIKRLRSIVPRYVKHLSGAKRIRHKLIAIKDYDDLEPVLREIETLGPDHLSPHHQPLSETNDGNHPS